MSQKSQITQSNQSIQTEEKILVTSSVQTKKHKTKERLIQTELPDESLQ